MSEVKMTEEALQKALTDAVKKGTEESKVEIKSLVDELAELKETTKKLAEKHASKLPEGEEKGAGMEKVGKLFKAMSIGDMSVAKGLSEGIDADGGFLVHSEFIAGVYRVMEDYGIARKFCSIYNMNSKDLEVTTLASNVSVYWINEGASITASNPTFGRVTITAKKLAALVEMTSELQEDSDSNIAETVSRLIAEQFARNEDLVVLTGTGTPFTGVLGHSDVTAVVLPATKTSFEDISSDDLVATTRAIAVKYKNSYKPRFYIHQDILAIIEKLKDSTGNPLYRNLNEAGKATLLGYPVVLTDVMPSISVDAVDTKFLIFGDLKFVGLGTRKNMTAETGYIDGGFQSDKKSLRVIQRVGTEVLIGEALATLKTAAA